MASVPKYKSIKQRDGDPISGRTKLIHDAHERIKLDSQEAPLRTPRKKMPFDNVDLLASTAFIVTGLACFISAVLLLLNRSSSFGDLQILSAKSVRGVDCSTIQVAEKASEAVITLMKEIRQGGVTSGPGSASRDIQKVFTLDFKTPSILSFWQVKTIDVFWNLVAGQGIRLVMGYITYIVSSYWFTTIILQSKLSYGFFAAVGFEGTTLSSTYETIKEFLRFSRDPKQNKTKDWFAVLTWMILGMIYTLSIPTLLNACSGYMVPSTSTWQMSDGHFVSDLASTIQGCWLIKDGERIGLGNEALVSGPLFKDFDKLLVQARRKSNATSTNWKELNTTIPRFDEITQYYGQLFRLMNNSLTEADIKFPEEDKPQWADYAISLFVNSTTNITINDKLIHLPAPPLDLGIPPSEMTRRDMSSQHETQPAFNALRTCYNNQELDDSFRPPLFCVSTSESYSWGFSRTLLGGLLIIHAVWCFSTWLVWLTVRRKSKRVEVARRGVFGNAVVVANSIQRDLGAVDGIEEGELVKRLAAYEGVGVKTSSIDRGEELMRLRRSGG